MIGLFSQCPIPFDAIMQDITACSRGTSNEQRSHTQTHTLSVSRFHARRNHGRRNMHAILFLSLSLLYSLSLSLALSLSRARALPLSHTHSLTHAHAQDESTDEDEEDDDDEAEDDDDVQEKEVKGTNFIDMIDKVLSKVDPAKFLVMIEKLNAALPPPGQSALEPFIFILQQACEVKAQLQVCVCIYLYISYDTHTHRTHSHTHALTHSRMHVCMYANTQQSGQSRGSLGPGRF